MELTAFKRYHQLLITASDDPKKMGFVCEKGDIIEFANRVRLVRSFRGLHLDGYKQDTVAGYDAFMLVFLTHSTLERYGEIIGIKTKDLRIFGPLLAPYQPEKVANDFVASDKNKRLYEFLYDRVNPGLKTELQMVYDRTSSNVACLSGAIRHIFAHGHLTAHANRIRPLKVNAECLKLSKFLVDFMDAEFTKIVDTYEKSSLLGG